MALPHDTLWEITPHTLAKHEILRRYLEAWFPIMSRYQGRIIYLDGFSGPGRYKGGEIGSPIIALAVAKNHRSSLNGKLVFWFVDENQDRIDHLCSELENYEIPDHFRVDVICGEFCEELEKVLDYLDSEGKRIAPTFAFVDPFGFSGISFEVIQRLLENKQCEVLINFMVDSINRFIDHPNDKIVKHIVDAFGTEDCISIAEAEGDRLTNLRILYQNQLKSVARFVRFFEMRDEKDRTQYFLFFASHHPVGHIKIKEAMWRVDPDGRYSFSDSTNQEQISLFDEVDVTDLVRTIREQFGNHRDVQCREIEEYVLDETAYIRKHMTQALRSMEAKGEITVDGKKSDGFKRRANTFSENVIVNIV